jgi:hypothetical protein
VSEDDDTVRRLPVRFKSPVPEERTLVVPYEIGRPPKCGHFMTSFIVDPAAAEVECARCGEKLNPMWVLAKLATEDRRMAESQARYQEEQKRLAERTRTKCDHCGKMTRISRR